MEFQPFTRHDLDLLGDYHALALDNHEARKGPAPTWERLRKAFGTVRPGMAQRDWLVRDGGEVVGHVALALPVAENRHLAMGVVQVRRDLRRRGIGRELYDFFVGRSREEGRTTVIAGVDEPLAGVEAEIDRSGSRFLTALGYEVALTSVHSRLDMSTVEAGAHERLAEQAGPHAAGYETLSWIEGKGGGECPEELVEDLGYLEYRLTTDMPLGDMDYEPERPDAARVRERALTAMETGQSLVHAAARHKATGKTVAWTFVELSRDDDEYAHQAITVVDPEHRGHRLGTLVKLENMRAALALRPALRYVDTDNAADNTPMIAVNTAIGYRPTHAQVTYQRRI
ncbi:GNAT family N-acetyltransferase [Phytomonospora sp. NPDC050363]|uniref:GNAT family N-acetyltransferase n=1 Tax=Phytomonospora sp. NPDC050363 TaxID=3155642 RepID=UPI00340C86ED